ncbi:mitochondrial chaperone BCS1 [Arthroderma uncinatum]|uniref:mitochondrial chaperone BCS1 n=1 Tax=Arthroderma uncinatum TaxID=74035 RepID=UPI00144AB1FE|nr:mitochondrial chaperone BCS1 [Arthroderma uncinatum]KAF3479550.1 mitochondrial chaperone BCS1 [Arthroderma uncinatum]
MNLTQLPNNILDALLPGYSVISGFIFQITGFDISVAVSLSVLIFTVTTAWVYCYKYAYSLLMTHMTASITVPSHDDIYDQVIAWVSELAIATTSRSMRAKSKRHMSWDSDEDLRADVSGKASQDTLLNFSNWEAKVPPRFEPHYEFSWFRHKGNYFKLSREKEPVLNGRMGFNMVSSDETLTITVLGRSLQPIKELIREARDASFARERSKTTIRRPGPKEFRSRGIYAWSRAATRPSRPIETVVLDNTQKTKLLLDINEYLHPATPRWYANRGIPYRRGYLFHGPPGTGKTSLSFAIAGVFGLDIYCISLLEPSLTEEDLGLLFNSLPRRCVVLLEDIDTAGLARTTADEDLSTETTDTTNETTDSVIPNLKTAVQQPANRAKKGKRANADEEPKGISLSGLLNAIDGVASHEGRVLVMTTNHPDKLDDALIRPGRVDMMVEFTLANREQIREIFIRMYSPDQPGSVNATTSSPSHIEKSLAVLNSKLFNHSKPEKSPASHDQSVADEKRGRECTSVSASHQVTITHINELATSFAALLPEYVFSPAEIQGFLLTRKREPHLAVEEVPTWCENLMVTRTRRHPTALSTSSTAVSKQSDKSVAESDNEATGTSADEQANSEAESESAAST